MNTYIVSTGDTTCHAIRADCVEIREGVAVFILLHLDENLPCEIVAAFTEYNWFNNETPEVGDSNQ